MTEDEPVTHRLTPDQAFSAATAHHGAGRLADAEAIYRKILSVEPAHPGALHHLGLIAFQAGQGKQALSLIERAIAANPDYAEAHCNRGVVLRGLGDLSGAEQAYRRALHLNKNYTDAWANLAGILITHGKAAEAESAARKSVALNPQQVDGWNNLGTALLDLDRAAESADALRTAIGLRPTHAESHYNLGNALKALGRSDEAIQRYRKAITLNPKLPHPYNNLAGLLLTEDRNEEALRAARHAVRLMPDDARIQATLGNALRATQRVEEATAAYRRSLELDPAYAEGWNNLGGTLNALGAFSEAEQAFRTAISLSPRLASAHRHLAMTKRFESRRDHDFQTLVDMAAAPEKMTGTETGHLHYALGKACADLGDTDAAFAHYAAGAPFLRQEAMGKTTAKPDRLVADMVERMIECFNSDWVEQNRSGGNPSDRPIFIVGMPRSGTTLVEQILASHPQVDPGGELPFFGRALTALGSASVLSREGVMRISALNMDQQAALGAQYVELLEQVQVGGGAPHITDKMPENYRFIGPIAAALPNARILHCSRDALDNCISCFTTCFAKGHAWSYDLQETGSVYRAYFRLMQHWRDVLPGRVFDISYEALVGDPEPAVRRILDHCGLPWNDACLEFHTHERPVLTASATQVRRPIYRSAIGRWREYEKHLGPLIHALGDLARTGNG